MMNFRRQILPPNDDASNIINPTHIFSAEQPSPVYDNRMKHAKTEALASAIGLDDHKALL
jgi:hypothetical protein